MSVILRLFVLNRNTQQTALRLMREKDINVIFNAEAISVHEKPDATESHYILCKNGMMIPFFETIWCTQVHILVAL